MAKSYKRHSTRFQGVYYIETTTNNQPDKTFYIRYKDEHNKDTELKIGSYSEGYRVNTTNSKRMEIISAIKEGKELPIYANKKTKNKTTVDEIAALYFEYRTIHHPKGKKTEEYRYNSHIKPLFGKILLNRITTEQIEKLQHEKLKTLAPKTVNHILTLFSTMFTHAIFKDVYKGTNPLSKIKKIKIDNKRERFLSTTEIKELIEEVRGNELIYIFCLLSLSTGGRATTIINIQKKHINLEHRYITLTDYKNSTTYKGFITQEITNILSILICNMGINEYILQINNKRIAISQMQKRLKPILDELYNEGLEASDSKNRVVIHTFRHSFASNLAIKGTPIFTIQKLLNHKDINMTLRYAKLSPDSGKDMVDSVMCGIV